MVKSFRGFTLMEMMVVLVIIGILAMFAMPVPQDNVTRKQIAESLELIELYGVPEHFRQMLHNSPRAR